MKIVPFYCCTNTDAFFTVPIHDFIYGIDGIPIPEIGVFSACCEATSGLGRRYRCMPYRPPCCRRLPYPEGYVAPFYWFMSWFFYRLGYFSVLLPFRLSHCFSLVSLEVSDFLRFSNRFHSNWHKLLRWITYRSLDVILSDKPYASLVLSCHNNQI